MGFELILTSSAPPVLRPLDLDRITPPAFLVFRLKDGGCQVGVDHTAGCKPLLRP